MRGKIKFPHRLKPVEREVHHDAGGWYIVSKGYNVPVVANGIEWEIAEGWRYLYAKEKAD